MGVLVGREAVRLAVLGQASGEEKRVVEGGKEVCEGKERSSGPLKFTQRVQVRGTYFQNRCKNHKKRGSVRNLFILLSGGEGEI